MEKNIRSLVKEYLEKYPSSTNSDIARKIISEEKSKLSLRRLREYATEIKSEKRIAKFLDENEIPEKQLEKVVYNEWTTTSFKNGEPVQATNTQVKVTYNPNYPKDFNFEEHLSKYQVEPVTNTEHTDSSKLALINIYDAHIDKLSYTNSDTIDDNVKLFVEAFNSLLRSTLTYNPNTIVFPVGSDFFNSNGLTNTTKRGTPMSNSILPHISFDIGLTAIRNCIDIARQHSNIIVLVIPGNHDEDTCFYLGKCLKYIYEKDSHVTIDDSFTRRKYISHGNNLIGFAHGDIEKKRINHLPLIMAEEQKELWSKTSYRYWYLGDIHHREEYKFMRTKDFIGAEVNFLRSISNLDKWHYDEGYIGIPKSADASIFCEDKGEIAKFKINI